MTTGTELKAHLPADIDAPDKLLFGLTLRQLAILGGTAVLGWVVWRALAGVVPPLLLVVGSIPLFAVAVAVALGRRDGLPLDLWLWHALRATRAPKRHAPDARTVGVVPLRLGVSQIDPDGTIRLADGQVAVIVACSTIGFFLRNPDEQAAAVETFSRWCNSLAAAAQITITTRPADLDTPAQAITDRLARLPDAALAEAAGGYAEFLRGLAAERDPLTRQVLVTHRGRDPAAARRAAANTARILAATGAATVVCDGPTVTDLLVTGCHPWQPARYGRTVPQATITGTDPPPSPPALQQAGETAGAADVAAVVGPDSVQVQPRGLRLGEGWTATFAVCGYPPMVAAAWLEPLLSWQGKLDLAIHVTPVPPEAAAAGLRKQRARLESSRRIDAEKGRLGDPQTDAAAQDAADLADLVARGASRLHRTGVYLTVHAGTEQELAESCAQIRAATAGLLLDLQPVTWRHLAGFTTTLPLAVDGLAMTRTLDTAALAAAIPVASPDLPPPLPKQTQAEAGILLGLNLTTGGVVWWDRWNADNHNSVVLARSGSGKSFLVKLEVLRNLYQGVAAAVIDPEDEYVPLAGHVGGAAVQLGAPGVRINPLDLPPGDRRPGAVNRRMAYLQTVIAVLAGAGTLTPAEAAVLDEAAAAAYEHVGITDNPATWQRPAPLLPDLAQQLRSRTDGRDLAARLAPYTTGSFADMFTGPTTTRPESHLVVWSLRHVPEELRTIATLLALDTVWRQVDNPTGKRRRRLIVVDEAWLMLRDGSAANWLYRMAKAARKRVAGLTVVTQDVDDVLATSLGRAVIANSATQILLRQAPQIIDHIVDRFHLTTPERQLLLAARRGEALLLAGEHRVAFEVLASEAELPLLATTPAVDEDSTADSDL